ncbi:hypothetical protein RAE19_07810 [Rhodoferax sp. TBRC 17660]|uniref:Uncharacterized protein n=1 Tax=Rhodoferax potami TaxID=3068338 RepID=A0ABU3KLI1_9BURK|nr:hypothetical protein [Rhodoferax sp. TBRC 17660]MDT7518611.1 hypothetical protein [Rhodoferax sp. TBRC 17660]
MNRSKLRQWWIQFLRPKGAYDEIDPGIKPLVDAMNATGVIKTIASCQGHASYGMPPYVYFNSTVEVAGLIERQLRKSKIDSAISFGGDWTIQGMFDEHCELRFILYSPFYHERSETLFAPIEFTLYRRTIAKDLLSLVDQVDKAVLPDVRE